MKIILDKDTAEGMLKHGFDGFMSFHTRKNVWEFCDEKHCTSIERIGKRKYRVVWSRRRYPYMQEFENLFETFDEALAYARVVAEAMTTAINDPETSIIEGATQSVKKLVEKGDLLLCDFSPLERFVAQDYTGTQDMHPITGFDKMFMCLRKI